MDKRALLACLENLNFTSLEAQIYLSLLEHGAQSGYQLAKTIQLSRPSIYNALEHLYEKGVVLRLPDKSSTYTAGKIRPFSFPNCNMPTSKPPKKPPQNSQSCFIRKRKNAS